MQEAAGYVRVVDIVERIRHAGYRGDSPAEVIEGGFRTDVKGEVRGARLVCAKCDFPSAALRRQAPASAFELRRADAYAVENQVRELSIGVALRHIP
ncbi:MAG: hypothetical protein ACI8X5_000052 [Planctomycetota bacterium]|jgi:hypothetical protein